MTFLQLCVLWRSEADLKVNHEICKERCKDIQNFVSDNIKKREPFSNIECKDLRLLIKNNQERSEIIMVFYHQCRFDRFWNNSNDPTIPSAAARVQNVLFINEHYLGLCSQLSDGLQHLVYLIIQYSYECVLKENNNESALNPFYMHLSGDAGADKRFLVKVLTRYLF